MSHTATPSPVQNKYARLITELFQPAEFNAVERCATAKNSHDRPCVLVLTAHELKVYVQEKDDNVHCRTTALELLKKESALHHAVVHVWEPNYKQVYALTGADAEPNTADDLVAAINEFRNERIRYLAQEKVDRLAQELEAARQGA